MVARLVSNDVKSHGFGGISPMKTRQLTGIFRETNITAGQGRTLS